MIFQIFDSPLADILILLLIVRIIFPRIFISRRGIQPSQKEKVIYHDRSSANSSSQKNQAGEYIEYEEIK
ncbi:MAG: hypothetical protein ACHQD9_01880 [Chitinophagales bacterium]